MEFVQLKCPNCHAELEAENTLDTVFCKYCGTKILLSGQDKEVVKAKTKLKLAEKALEFQQEHNRMAAEKRAFQEKQRMKNLGILLGILGLVVAGCIVALIISHGGAL